MSLILLMWHIGTMLGNYRETIKNSHCQVTAQQTSMFPRQRENIEIMKEMFSTGSVPRCYSQEHLAAAVS
jgi:hypothetical protein